MHLRGRVHVNLRVCYAKFVSELAWEVAETGEGALRILVCRFGDGDDSLHLGPRDGWRGDGADCETEFDCERVEHGDVDGGFRESVCSRCVGVDAARHREIRSRGQPPTGWLGRIELVGGGASDRDRAGRIVLAQHVGEGVPHLIGRLARRKGCSEDGLALEHDGHVLRGDFIRGAPTTRRSDDLACVAAAGRRAPD